MSSNTIYHTHHIIPKYMGGTDDPSNLVQLTVEEHAQAHLELYEKYGDERDLVAHRMLLGQIDRAEAIKIIQKLPKTEKWKKQKSEAMKGVNNPQYGKTTSDKQKKAVAEAAKERFTGVPKWYKVTNPVMYGSDNPRSRRIYAEGKEYDTISECCKVYGFKYHNTVRYRLNHPKWPEWYYL